MRRQPLILLLVAWLPASVIADGYSAGFAPASHNVERTSTPPVIDGMISGNEWGMTAETNCSPGDQNPGGQPITCNVADRWVDLNTNAPDEHNLRFRMLWDDSHLYVMGRSDYDGFVTALETESVQNAPNPPNFSGSGYATSFYFDPNRDGERTWDPLMPVEESTVDGYQIAWDVYEGFSSRRPTSVKPEQPLRDPLDNQGQRMNDYYGGFQLEAHVNAVDGNHGAWSLPDHGPNGNYRDDAFPGLQFAQHAHNEDDPATPQSEQPGLVWEWAIPWSIFNATDPNRRVTPEEAAARPATVLDTRELLIAEDPDNPGGLLVLPNPDFNKVVPNEGQIPGIEAFIGNAGQPDLRFSDADSAVFLENGLYAPNGPSAGDVWGFEASVFTDDFENALPSWSEPGGGDPTRGNSFPLWGTAGHGQLVFLPDGVKDMIDPPDPNEETCTVPPGALPGDLDLSNDVGFADFLVLSGNFGDEDVGYEGGDIDCDGSVGFSDFLVLSGNFGQSSGAVSSVPETTWSPIMLLGVIALGLRRLSRTKQ